MKKIFALILAFMLVFCCCSAEGNEAGENSGDKWDTRPMLCIDNVYYADPYMPVSELPEGYEYAGTLTAEQAYNTGLEGIEYYANPETDDFYTWQETGTPIGDNVVDSTVRSMHYLQWIPVSELDN